MFIPEKLRKTEKEKKKQSPLISRLQGFPCLTPHLHVPPIPFIRTKARNTHCVVSFLRLPLDPSNSEWEKLSFLINAKAQIENPLSEDALLAGPLCRGSRQLKSTCLSAILRMEKSCWNSRPFQVRLLFSIYNSHLFAFFLNILSLKR